MWFSVGLLWPLCATFMWVLSGSKRSQKRRWSLCDLSALALCQLRFTSLHLSRSAMYKELLAFSIYKLLEKEQRPSQHPRGSLCSTPRAQSSEGLRGRRSSRAALWRDSHARWFQVTSVFMASALASALPPNPAERGANYCSMNLCSCLCLIPVLQIPRALNIINIISSSQATKQRSTLFCL